MEYKDWKKWMINHPWSLKCGKGWLSKRYKVPEAYVTKARQEIKGTNTNKCKILVLDIETSPLKAYVWKRWKENIALDQTISEWFMICWSAKWLDDDVVFGECLTPEEIKNEDDSRITSILWSLLDECNVVIAHNGKRFDIPKINSRFVLNGLPPTSPYKIVDTLEIAKKQFGFSSNKLDALATYFGIENKDKTDFNLWKRCLDGEQEALDYMLKYNKKDVAILNDVYLKLRPWDKKHPNLATILDSSNPICPICGSTHIRIIKGDKYYHTQLSKYNTYRCEDCGAVLRDRSKINEKTILMST